VISRTNRQLVLDIRQVLAELETLSEAKAAGVLAFSGSSTKPGHRILWTERDTGPASLHEVFVDRFARARNREEVEATLHVAREELQNARVRPLHQRIDGDWRPVFVSSTAGMHYAAAAHRFSISGSYARKLRRQNGVGQLFGGPLCHSCEREMLPDQGVVPLWRCAGCFREIPREVHA
jgi:hypothetical protein